MTDRSTPAEPRSATRRTHGPAVRAIREALGIRHGVFAVDCDITPGYLTRIEQGHKQPSPPVAAAIAARLGVPLDAIQYVVEEGAGAHKADAA